MTLLTLLAIADYNDAEQIYKKLNTMGREMLFQKALDQTGNGNVRHLIQCYTDPALRGLKFSA
ncbi:MAG TPA: hypothetical protein DCD96_05225 [Flavobacteriales bacterium]|nr:hypothetical protein [Flavobacteriales bacterium]